MKLDQNCIMFSKFAQLICQFAYLDLVKGK